MSGPSEAQKTVEEFSKQMENLDARQASSMMRSYAPVYNQLTREMEELVRKSVERDLKPWEVMRSRRLKDIERQFLSRMDEFATAGGGLITDGQRAAVGLARRGARQTVASALPNGVTMDNLANIGLEWNRLPDDAFTNFVGIAADGKPVGRLLEPLGVEAAQEVRGAINTGIGMGKGVRGTAKLIETAAGMPLTRALLITRTETNRAFREATRLEYASNSRVVKGYRRMAAKSGRTCMACIALDGERYGLNEPLNEHPNGRCSMVPDVLDYADLGLDVERQESPEDAREWLGRQDEIVQRKILGNTRLQAWQAGEIQLNQLATVKTSKVWGDAAVIRPIKDLGLGKRGPGGVAPPKPSPRRRPGTGPEAAVPEPPPLPDDLIDPKTGVKVRGTRTAPPEPTLPPGWVDDADDFLDLSSDIGRGTVKQQINEQVREQEAWARAVGGAIEANYQGLSIRAAEQVNKAVEVTIVRNRWRPLDIITTERLPGRGGSFGRAYAYQSGNGVHINAASASRARIGAEKGSVRAWDRGNLADNAHVKQRAEEGGTRLADLEAKLTVKRGIYNDWKKKKAPKDLIYDPELEGRMVPGTDYKRWIERYEKSVKKAKTSLAKAASERFHSTTGQEFLKEVITHEIGHYAHRRWGFTERRSLDLFRYGKKGKAEARQLSEYAMKNDVEHFAEAFTEHIWLGGARNSPEVTSFIEDVMKANTTYADRERIFRQ